MIYDVIGCAAAAVKSFVNDGSFFVELRKVNDELFVAGKEIRDGVLGVVDRVIDDVMSCTTRGQAFLVLHNALSQELERISNLPKRINNG